MAAVTQILLISLYALTAECQRLNLFDWLHNQNGRHHMGSNLPPQRVPPMFQQNQVPPFFIPPIQFPQITPLPLMKNPNSMDLDNDIQPVEEKPVDDIINPVEGGETISINSPVVPNPVEVPEVTTEIMTVNSTETSLTLNPVETTDKLPEEKEVIGTDIRESSIIDVTTTKDGLIESPKDKDLPTANINIGDISDVLSADPKIKTNLDDQSKKTLNEPNESSPIIFPDTYDNMKQSKENASNANVTKVNRNGVEELTNDVSNKTSEKIDKFGESYLLIPLPVLPTAPCPYQHTLSQNGNTNIANPIKNTDISEMLPAIAAENDISPQNVPNIVLQNIPENNPTYQLLNFVPQLSNIVPVNNIPNNFANINLVPINTIPSNLFNTDQLSNVANNVASNTPDNLNNIFTVLNTPNNFMNNIPTMNTAPNAMTYILNNLPFNNVQQPTSYPVYNLVPINTNNVNPWNSGIPLGNGNTGSYNGFLQNGANLINTNTPLILSFKDKTSHEESGESENKN